MKTLVDPSNALAQGLATVRSQFKVPAAFPPNVLAAAEAAAKRVPTEHVDRTAMPFVTLDPATSTDLDQAFAIEAAGSDLLLRYAIADVAWFVDEGGAIDAEAWRRGCTLYLPDGKARLYPAVLSEQAASLLPDGPRPAVIFTVRVDPDGGAARIVAWSSAFGDKPPASAALRGQVLDEPADDRLVRLVDLDVGERAVGRAVRNRPQHRLHPGAELGVAIVLEQADRRGAPSAGDGIARPNHAPRLPRLLLRKPAMRARSACSASGARATRCRG